MDTYKKHKKEKSLLRWLEWIEWMSGHNECCSGPSPHSFPACDLFERNTFMNTEVGEMIAPAKEKRNTSSIGAWPKSLDQRPSKYWKLTTLLKKILVPSVVG